MSSYYLEGRIGALELVALLHPFGAAVLRVAAVFQSATLLLQSDDLLAREAVQLLVQLANRERDELVVVEQVVAHLVVAPVAARAGTEAHHHAGAHLRAGRRRRGARRTGAHARALQSSHYVIVLRRIGRESARRT